MLAMPGCPYHAAQSQKMLRKFGKTKSEQGNYVCRKEGKGFGKAPPPPKPSTSSPELPTAGKRFELEPYDIEEWREWLKALKTERKASTDHLYVQVQLDGSVRTSGEGAPSWERLLNDLPTLDSLRTRVTDGLRR